MIKPPAFEKNNPEMTGKALTHKAKILVVEDEPIVAMHTKQRLERMGYKVTGVASSGDEAIQQVQKTRPDLIIMDVHLQGKMDGVETAEQILRLGELPIIYQTAYADEKTLQRAMQSSVDGYIIKPCE